mmetsp:Transcript_100905/g.263087  ORF Transcript_100905/g.263087 Transcript_100905/m.263087 type:complete len:419 (+) Transcript_100905:1020-2276(+)
MGNREAKTDALVAPYHRVVLLFERQEDAIQSHLRDALAGVGNHDLDPLAIVWVHLRGHNDLALLGELASVRDEIVEDLRAFVSVRLNDRQLTDLAGKLHIFLQEAFASLVQGVLDKHNDLIQDLAQLYGVVRQFLDRLLLVFRVRRHHAGHVHDVHDEIQKPCGAARRHLQETKLAGDLLLVAEVLHEAYDTVQRASEFVRDDGHEIDLALLGFPVRRDLGEVISNKGDALDEARLVPPGCRAEHQRGRLQAEVLATPALELPRVQCGLHAAALVAQQGFADNLLCLGPAPYAHHVNQLLAHGEVCRQAGQLYGLLVPLVDQACIVRSDDGHGRHLDEGLEIFCHGLRTRDYLVVGGQVVRNNEHYRRAQLERDVEDAIEFVFPSCGDPTGNGQQVHDTVGTDHDHEVEDQAAPQPAG